MRLIDADALDFTPEHNGEAVVFNGVAFVGRSAGKSMGAFAKVLKHMVDNAPTIDAVPVVHARWEWRETWGSGAFQDPPEIYDAGWACSACGVDLLRYLQSHFPDIPSYTECASEEMPTLERCPCCGAKMDGGV